MRHNKKHGYAITSAGGVQKIDLDFVPGDSHDYTLIANVSGSASLTLIGGAATTIAGTLTSVEVTVSVWDGTTDVITQVDGPFEYLKLSATSAGTWNCVFIG